MRIVYLTAGAGSLRCGACAHDYMLVSRLRQLAHDVRVIPVYTPMHTDLGELPVGSPIFLGGISAYLRVQSPGLKRAWRLLRPVLDSKPLLELAARGMVYTDPRDLGELTLTVLQGEDGPHAAEISRLVNYIRKFRPEIVYLTNSMLSPLAGSITKVMQIPVVCGFMGEDSFVMDLPDPYRAQCIALLRRHAANLSRILCPSNAAAHQADLLLGPSPDRLHVISAPVDINMYAPQSNAPVIDPPTIGYLSCIRPSKGLDILVRALGELGEWHDKPLRVLIAGQVMNAQYLRDMRKLIQELPAHINCEILGELSLEDKVSMWRQCTLGVFPSRIAEARGLATMEAMAAEVPVVVPSHGCFPELVASGGGWLYEPGNTAQLAGVLRNAIASPQALKAAATAARAHMIERHDPLVVAREFELVCFPPTR